MAQTPLHKLTRKYKSAVSLPQLVGQFNLSWTTSTVSDWVSVIGDPNTSILTGTDTRAGSVTVTTIATGDTYWDDNALGAAAGYVTEVDANGSWPAELGSGYFFKALSSYPGGGNFRIGGLVAGATYSIAILSNRPTASDGRTTSITCIDNATTEAVEIISAPSGNSTTPPGGFTGTINQVTSAGTVVTFIGKIATSGGEISFGITPGSGYIYGYINAVKITRTL